jgi:putative DNA primase/helicase
MPETHLRPVPKKEDPPDPEVTAREKDFILTCLQCNEDGDAALFRHRAPDFVFDHTGLEWNSWTEHYWQLDEKGAVFTAFDRVIQAYGDEANRTAWQATKAQKAGDEKEAKALLKKQEDLLKRIRALQARPRKQNVLFLAAQGYGVTADQWDRDPWAFACANGIIDLRTGELRPGRPEDYIRTVSPTKWEDIATPSPQWEAFLFSIFGEDEPLVHYTQRLLGAALPGILKENILPILWGQGRNGKTTLIETIASVLGPYSHKARAETLLDSNTKTSKGAADSDTLALKGKRLVFVAETNDGRRFDASHVKHLTGGDTLNARGPYDKRPTVFQPSHTLILLTNHKPHAPASDFAFWERVHLIPFNYSFVDREPQKENERRADKNLPARLKEEASGILAWLVRGCLKWQQIGLAPPASVREATQDYHREEDIVGQYLADCCDIGPGRQVQSKILYDDYVEWFAQNGMGKPISQKAFNKELKMRFDYTTGRHLFFVGIELKTSK